MSEAVNPWLPHPVEMAPETVRQAAAPKARPATGPTSPQRGVAAPPEAVQLTVTVRQEQPALWWLGVHGGAGESMLAAAMLDSLAADHAWPRAIEGEPAPVVLVARTNMRGLMAAQGAVTQWASGAVPGVRLLGLVLMADAPGRLPRPLRDLTQVVGGGAPRVWSVPWVGSWRMVEDPAPDDLPREVCQLVDDLHALLNNPN